MQQLINKFTPLSKLSKLEREQLLRNFSPIGTAVIYTIGVLTAFGLDVFGKDYRFVNPNFEAYITRNRPCQPV